MTKKTVLLVEDDPGVQKILVRSLEKGGLNVVAVSNGNAAIKSLADHGADVDIMITDMVMPGMGGAELIETVRERREDLPVIAMSGYSEHTIAAATGNQSNFRLLSKPFKYAQLIETVRELLADG